MAASVSDIVLILVGASGAAPSGPIRKIGTTLKLADFVRSVDLAVPTDHELDRWTRDFVSGTSTLRCFRFRRALVSSRIFFQKIRSANIPEIMNMK